MQFDVSNPNYHPSPDGYRLVRQYSTRQGWFWRAYSPDSENLHEGSYEECLDACRENLKKPEKRSA
ncbi:MAG: hypothetical protein R3221_02905 [Spongiibacter sp.]|nr:hypothetical protein [Spongiibacter sp.]